MVLSFHIQTSSYLYVFDTTPRVSRKKMQLCACPCPTTIRSIFGGSGWGGLAACLLARSSRQSTTCATATSKATSKRLSVCATRSALACCQPARLSVRVRVYCEPTNKFARHTTSCWTCSPARPPARVLCRLLGSFPAQHQHQHQRPPPAVVRFVSFTRESERERTFPRNPRRGIQQTHKQDDPNQQAQLAPYNARFNRPNKLRKWCDLLLLNSQVVGYTHTAPAE